jgi:hypothetical protein
MQLGVLCAIDFSHSACAETKLDIKPAHRKTGEILLPEISMILRFRLWHTAHLVRSKTVGSAVLSR